MPRRLKLSPMQRDIAMMLEETGAETVGTVIATLKPSNQTEFGTQVDGLVALALIRKEGNNLKLTEQGRIALERRLVLEWQNIAVALRMPSKQRAF